MRITGTVVREIADYATEFTGNAFRLQAIGGDIGHGTRYIDGVRQLVWLGSTGAREACAYYLGAIDGWAEASGIEGPARQAVVLARAEITENDRRARIMRCYESGKADAVSRHAYHNSPSE